MYRTSIYVILANSGSMSGAGAGIQPAAVIPAKAGIQPAAVIPAKAGI